MILFLMFACLSLLYNLYLQTKISRDNNKTKQNSQVFSQPFTPIWKSAVRDWIDDYEDERTFEQFLTDTLDLIARGTQR